MSIPDGSYVTNLSATNSKRSENTIVGMHALAGRTRSRQLSQAYHDGRLRISRVRMTEYLAEYSHSSAVFPQCNLRERVQADPSRSYFASWKQDLVKALGCVGVLPCHGLKRILTHPWGLGSYIGSSVVHSRP